MCSFRMNLIYNSHNSHTFIFLDITIGKHVFVYGYEGGYGATMLRANRIKLHNENLLRMRCRLNIKCIELVKSPFGLNNIISRYHLTAGQKPPYPPTQFLDKYCELSLQTEEVLKVIRFI